MNARHIAHPSGITVLILLFASALVLSACSASSTGSSSAAASASASASAASGTASSTSSSGSDPSASANASSQSASDAEGVVTINLDYSAGTGFEWRYDMQPQGIAEQVGDSTTSEGGADADEPMSGGPLQDHFTFRAQAPGEVELSFTLERPWSGEVAETQVYAFTVTDDLQMILNPYKSQFDIEPTWGGNS